MSNVILYTKQNNVLSCLGIILLSDLNVHVYATTHCTHLTLTCLAEHSDCDIQTPESKPDGKDLLLQDENIREISSSSISQGTSNGCPTVTYRALYTVSCNKMHLMPLGGKLNT